MMTALRRLWVPLLVGLLVTGASGIGAGAVEAEPRLTTASIMVPAAAFIPGNSATNYANDGNSLSVTSGTANFYAPLWFPVPVVNIKRITLYAYDNSASQICVGTVRTRPADAATDPQNTVCTQDASAPQAVYTTEVTYPRVTTGLQGSYVWVGFYGSGVQLFAVKVNYSY